MELDDVGMSGHSFELLPRDNNVSLIELVMEDYSYDIEFQYEILKREGAELIPVEVKEVTLPLNFPIEAEPSLTKFEMMQGFPLLEPVSYTHLTLPTTPYV